MCTVDQITKQNTSMADTCQNMTSHRLQPHAPPVVDANLKRLFTLPLALPNTHTANKPLQPGIYEEDALAHRNGPPLPFHQPQTLYARSRLLRLLLEITYVNKPCK